ncbi:ATP-binding protein [Patescibacteria group bacterium]|nr:ATP-binding protein [Patescibacteria group bacterium]MBU4480900.1 ATP-binding protein [Patescibacteria group bacterium]
MVRKETLAQIILDFQKDDLPELIERELGVDLEIPIKRAITILGPRRSGKTYYLYSLIKNLLKKGIKKERILYINFEDPKLVALSLSDLSVFLEVFYEIYPQNKNQKVWLFFDEIQNIKNWELFVRNILDKEKAYIFISGSSSKLLSKEIATSLRGRTLNYLILPFSFKEFLKLKNITYKKYLSSSERANLLNSFREYFSWGGYPELLIYPKEKRRLINEIIEVTIYQDLIERHKIRNTKVIKLMFNYLVKAKEFSVHKFYNFLKSLNIKVSKNSLYNYLEFFNDAFIFFPLRKFAYSLKNTEQSIPKIYTVDNALIENIIGDDKSKKFENLVFLSLLRKGLERHNDIFYSSFNSQEVDFLIKKGRKISTLIQACFDINDYKTKERELKSLLKAGEEFQCSDLLIITSDYESEEKFKGKKIKFIPLWQWLLR